MNQNELTDISFDELFGMEGVELENNTSTEEQEETQAQVQTQEDTEVQTSEEESQGEAQVQTPEQEKTDSPYFTLLKSKLASGAWGDISVTIDEEEVNLSELSDIDEDTYNKILFATEGLKKEEELSKDYIKLDSLDETKKSLVNLIIHGDLDKARELFEQPQALVEPFQNYDSDSEEHNEQVLSWYYQQQGNSKKEIDALIKIAKEDLTLDSKASKVVEWQREQFRNNLKAKEEEVLAEKAKEAENLKVYRKDINSEFKGLGISENLSKKFTDLATKYDNSGELEVDKKYDELMRDPKEAVNLIQYMYDRDNFIKRITADIKRNVTLDLASKANVIKITKKAQTITPKQEELDNPFPDLVFE